MHDIKDLSDAQKAVLLLYKGLYPKLSTTRGGQEDYKDLLRYYHANPEFRELVGDLAPMLDLRIIKALENRIILTPLNSDSLFAPRLTDIRKGLDADTVSRGAIALIYIAIAATFYPTADRLEPDSDDYYGPSITPLSATPKRIVDLLRSHCDRLEEEADSVQELNDAGLSDAWRELSRMPDSSPENIGNNERASMRSLFGIVKYVLNQLVDYGMMGTTESQDGTHYMPTERYRLQVKEMASNELYRRCISFLPNENSPRGMN